MFRTHLANWKHTANRVLGWPGAIALFFPRADYTRKPTRPYAHEYEITLQREGLIEFKHTHKTRNRTTTVHHYVRYDLDRYGNAMNLTCTCPNFESGFPRFGRDCKHTAFARLVLQGEAAFYRAIRNNPRMIDALRLNRRLKQQR